jgi:predicted phosphohydrolase
VFGIAACGGGSPKSLAKEGYELTQKALAGKMKLSDADKKKEEEWLKKVEKLSEADQKIVREEMMRLSKEKK